MSKDYEITLNARTLKALLAVAPKDDVRYFLNGICLDFKAGCAVVTDGHMMIAVEWADEIEDLPQVVPSAPFATVIVPRSAIDGIKKDGYGNPPKPGLKIGVKNRVRFSGTIGKPGRIEAVSGPTLNPTVDAAVEFTPVDGRYPDWRRVMPSHWDCEDAQKYPAKGPTEIGPLVAAPLLGALKALGNHSISILPMPEEDAGRNRNHRMFVFELRECTSGKSNPLFGVYMPINANPASHFKRAERLRLGVHRDGKTPYHQLSAA